MRYTYVFGLHCRWAMMALVVLPALTACAKSPVPVSVHGVNYGDDEFSYIIEDPENAKNTAGGETIAPFAAGGTMCCYELPAKWHSGIRVKIIAKHWLKAKPDGSLPEVLEAKIVEVPPYLDNKAGELWVLRAANGQMNIISSDFQPDHPKWPGKLKGWPVPSKAYLREQWMLVVEHEQDNVDLYRGFLQEMHDHPVEHARESWGFAKERDPQSISGFSGPQDQAYQTSLVKGYEESLLRVERRLKELKEQRP